MPVFKVGTFADIGVELPTSASLLEEIGDRAEVAVAKVIPLHALRELSFRVEQPSISLARSTSAWSVYLRELTLNKSFEGFIANLFKPQNEIYFTSIAWDYGGSVPFVYPPSGTDPSEYVLTLHAGESRDFIGDGVALWPSQLVTGSLNLVILVYENDQKVRDVGNILSSIHDSVSGSKLNALLLAISANPTLATAVAVEEAVNELLGIVGKLMKLDKNDFVDLFEGSYGAEKEQQSQVRTYAQDAATVEIDFVTAPSSATTPSETADVAAT